MPAFGNDDRVHNFASYAEYAALDPPNSFGDDVRALFATTATIADLRARSSGYASYLQQINQWRDDVFNRFDDTGTFDALTAGVAVFEGLPGSTSGDILLLHEEVKAVLDFHLHVLHDARNTADTDQHTRSRRHPWQRSLKLSKTVFDSIADILGDLPGIPGLLFTIGREVFGALAS